MQEATESALISGVSAREVRAALEKVVTSAALQRTPQLQRLLRFLVEDTLAGRGERLKEYVIGIEVFGRPQSYDPRIDSLVRVEALRLRRALEEYYTTEGREDSVRIDLSKGGYHPTFVRCTSDAGDSIFKMVLSHSRWTGLTVIFCLAVGLSLAMYIRTQRSPSPLQTIAVLPFDNLSNDPENPHLCFGLMDEVTTELAKVPGLRVVARSSAANFKRGDDIRDIARRLNVQAVLEGSVRKSGETVLVTAQLIRAEDGMHVWSETYERSDSDLIRIQDEIAQEITHGLRSALPQGSHANSHRFPYSLNPDANRLYWKGAYLRTPMGHTNWRVDLAKSVEFLEHAVQLDPHFTLAYSALADIYVSLAWERGGGDRTREYMERGRVCAEQAVELDNSVAEAYGALGAIQFFYDYDPDAAERSFRRAIQLDESNGKVRMWYAYALVMQRRFDEALSQAKQARELDPLSYVSTTHLAVVEYLSGHNDEAIQVAQETLEIADIAPAHGLLGMAYEVRKNYAEAIAQYRLGLRLVPKHAYLKGMLGHAYAVSGSRKEAVEMLKDAGMPFEEGGLSDLKVAYILVGLGDYDQAFVHLERDFKFHDPELPSINVDPVFDPVRNDVRFLGLLERLHLRGH